VSNGAPLSETEYAGLVTRVQAFVAAHVPPGSSVLVVSKGDADLLAMPGLSASHFPQDGAGEYAGHHPRDSAVAIGSLEELRRHGAEYLVIPRTARWWLDYYAELATHLATHAVLVADEPASCLIYGLGGFASEGGGHGPDLPTATVEQVRDYLERLLPPDAKLVVLEEESDRITAGIAPLKATRFDGSSGVATSLGELERLGATGRYLVVPRSEDDWFDRRSGLAPRIEASCAKVADQRHLCRVFDLRDVRGLRR
jgi:hypothetical protein